METTNKTIKVQFKCPKCERVCISIEGDGICGSPACRKNINTKEELVE